MYIEKTIKIYFDLDEIKKNICKHGWGVKEAIHDYATALNDGDYYNLTEEDYDKVYEELKKDGFED